MEVNDLSIALLAVKDLEIRTLKDRITQLENWVRSLNKENDELYGQIAALQEKKCKEHKVGFNTDKE